MKTLHLVLKSKWYDMIACGEKKEEYREITPYWANRLLQSSTTTILGQKYWNYVIPKYLQQKASNSNITDLINDYSVRDFTHVCFHKGYTSQTITFCIEKIVVETGKEEWGAEQGQHYFVIKLGKEINNETNPI